MEKPDIPPLDLVVAELAALERLTSSTLQEFAELDSLDLRISLNAGIEAVLPAPDRIYYRVRDDTAERLAILATGDPESFEVTRKICAANVFYGQPVPAPLRATCLKLICGTFDIPKQSGPKPGKRFGLFFLVTGIAHLLKDAYGMPLTRGDGMSEHSAADILSEALNEFGIDCSYVTIRDWLTHRKHRLNRGKADVMWALAKDDFLMEVGVISNRTDWVTLAEGLRDYSKS